MPLQAIKKGCLIDSSDTQEIKLNFMTNFDPLEVINSLKLRLEIGEKAIKLVFTNIMEKMVFF